MQKKQFVTVSVFVIMYKNDVLPEPHRPKGRVSIALSQTPGYTVKPWIVSYPHLLYAACLITT